MVGIWLFRLKFLKRRLVVQNLKMAWSRRFIPKLIVWHSSRDIVRMKWRYYQAVVLSTTHHYQAWGSICWFWSTIRSTRSSQYSVQRAACPRPKGQVKRLSSRLLWKPHRLGWLLNNKRMFSGYQVSPDEWRHHHNKTRQRIWCRYPQQERVQRQDDDNSWMTPPNSLILNQPPVVTTPLKWKHRYNDGCYNWTRKN